MSNQIFNLSRIILKNNLHCRLLHIHPHIPIETQCRVVAFPYIQNTLQRYTHFPFIIRIFAANITIL